MGELLYLSIAFLFSILNCLASLDANLLLKFISESGDGVLLVSTHLIDLANPAFVIVPDLVLEFFDGFGEPLLLLLQLDVDLGLLLRVVLL
jgi:hypothetical protein